MKKQQNYLQNTSKRDNQQKGEEKIIFQSSILNNISVYKSTLKVVIQEKTYKQEIQPFDNVFKTYFTSTDFLKLQSLKMKDYTFEVLSQINAPLLDQLQIHNQKRISLNQFESSKFQSLKQISIRSGQMLSLPKFNAIKLQKIKVDCNGKPLIIKDFCQGNYPGLVYIQFYFNKIDIFPEIKNCPSLSELHIQRNNINSLDQFARGMYPSLKIIKADSNQITQLPQFQDCPSIQKLIFLNNKIKSIQKFSNGKYPHLKHLNLCCNQIKQLPLINAQNLKQLYLTRNQLASINKNCQFKYQKLKFLSLSANLLTQISINTPILKHLNASNNKIKQFDIFYSPNLNQELEELSCSFNLIKTIPQFLTFHDYYHLKKLSLRSCEIQNIEILSQIYMNPIEFINLQKNRIVNFKVFDKLVLPSIKNIVLLENLSYVRSSMARCQIGCNQDENQQQKVEIHQETIDECYNLNWIFKHFKKGIKMNLAIYSSRSFGFNFRLNQAFNRKGIYRQKILDEEFE